MKSNVDIVSKYIKRSYRLHRSIVMMLEDISKSFSDEAKADVSMGKIIEYGILAIKNKKYREVLDIVNKVK